VDGRNVPLRVGYHKVSVVIRDQIAETTVEESFVNATRQTLEGVFTFPLPADASISGFGMWVGDELVMADIVERQRARAIYEDILRRRKDPGLLEWSGGNLFKARVFPIPAGGEKRIRIRYTQVLPLEGTTIRYRYALRSELLRTHPLRQLAIKVSVDSTAPIRSAASPTHEVRARVTEHSAVLEFDAEEYRPDRDFEAAIRLDRSRPLTVVPHRRGEDGYFMLLLSPPDPAAGDWERGLLPEGEPLHLVLVADTSSSMDDAARKAQAELIQALLSLLGPEDSFELATSDVTVRWFRERPAPVTERNVDDAIAFLAARDSLGWTDLDLALSEATAKAAAGANVVYLGDGIPTARDPDPVAQARRIEALREDAKATFHAFSVSSAYEKGVIEAIASIGSGSVRAVGDDPGRAASAFLAEIAQPAVRDLEVEFDGVRTARVYPERLPNLPAGRQQVVLGRFLPSGGAQKGSVVVTGTRDGKPVRFTAPFEIQEGETGNSFLPRLWARLHVEALLREGRSASVKEDIVAFSEEYGIITPYTSFLVLESDEDRRRYGVDRRVAMRDGERFFAEAKDRASTEILRQQMQKARTYRLKLRRRMLREIARLGRDLAVRGAGWGDVGGFKEAEYLGHGQSEKRRAFEEPVIRDGKVADRSSEGEELTDEEYDAETPDDAPPAAPPPEEPAPEMARDSLLEEAGESQRVDFDSYGARLEAESLREVSRPRGGSARYWRPYSALFTGHFPMVPAAPEAAPAERPDWPEEVIALLASLDRRAPLASLDGGVALVTLQIGLHPLRGDRTSLARSHGVYSSRGWFLAQWGRSRLPHHQWAFEGTRGSLAAEADLTAFTGLPGLRRIRPELRQVLRLRRDARGRHRHGPALGAGAPGPRDGPARRRDEEGGAGGAADPRREGDLDREVLGLRRGRRALVGPEDGLARRRGPRRPPRRVDRYGADRRGRRVGDPRGDLGPRRRPLPRADRPAARGREAGRPRQEGDLGRSPRDRAGARRLPAVGRGPGVVRGVRRPRRGEARRGLAPRRRPLGRAARGGVRVSRPPPRGVGGGAEGPRGGVPGVAPVRDGDPRLPGQRAPPARGRARGRRGRGGRRVARAFVAPPPGGPPRPARTDGGGARGVEATRNGSAGGP
ncbi:MAG: VIT domain-containing protein, partial [Planctomycetota bacterium]|jgi:hypothetical protein